MITVKSQADWDALPKEYAAQATICIQSPADVWVRITSTPKNSHVEARGSSHVEARGSSHVVAWGSSHVEARGSVAVHVQSDYSTVSLFRYAVAFLLTTKAKAERKSKTSRTIKPKPVKGLNGWLESQAITPARTIILFKRVSHDFKTQEGTKNETLWQIGATLTHKAWEPTNGECGEGKFHACSRPYFCDQFRSIVSDKYVAIQITSKNLYAWPNGEYPHKIAFREGKVLYQCDRFGAKIG